MCYQADVPFLRVFRRVDMSRAIERLVALALQEVFHIGEGKPLLSLRAGLHHKSFPDRIVLLHVPARCNVSCLPCAEDVYLQATSSNATLILPSSLAAANASPSYARRRMHRSPGYKLSLPICQVVLIAGLIVIPFRRQFGERRIKLLGRQRQLATQQGFERGEACQNVLFQHGSGVPTPLAHRHL